MGELPDTTDRTKPRLAGLDGLRLVAILLVLGRHMPLPPETWGGRAIFLTWQRGGWVGVDLFFVLSGFLVSGLLLNEYKSRGRLSIGRFYMRRGWKIYPPFFTLIAVTVIVTAMFGVRVAGPRLASELLFLQSYVPGLWNHTWSLAVEEHFYLALPVVLTVVLKLNARSETPLKPILPLAAGVAILALLLRLLAWRDRPTYSHLTNLFPSHLRMDSLFFGVAISYVYHVHTRRFVEALSPWRRWLIVGGIVLLTPAFIFELETTPFIFTVGLTLFCLASGMLLVGILLCSLPRNRLVVFLATLGAYSYSIYLWHMPMNRWGVPLFELLWGTQLSFGARAIVYLLGALVVGIVMAKAVEVPALRVRDRWFPPPNRERIDGQPIDPLLMEPQAQPGS